MADLPDEPSYEQLRNQAKDLRLGADPDIRDHRFGSTPLGWACHFGQQPLIDLLEPLTAPEPETSDG